ncbi:MAG: serine/threonine protein kinase [Amycolatopsis sp.]|uniref:Stk1 family PASTA domain-containing Ser/Thr kinase n=1 Tax=Amycolatopsis sp. TaxID=37632 RepID=UPI0026138027|nr:Stk1 family PASTA domain-containing Ser/Thr kinase [Amycolatopsis sp.]MCU1685643.1 serine/threonine protein kinase [Amycolatopsis sp.]
MSTPRLLSNRYELGDTLGYGGMSEVHHGHDVRLGREVAIKILRADLARDPQFQERFRREAQNAAALNHPAIVAVYDTGEAQTEVGPLPYIVMEYVEGRTLRDIVKTEGPMSQKRAMEVMADVCAALDFSHRHGIIHRDVKPANVMITKNGAVKVMDFGIARALHDGQAAMTQTAAVIGTAQYLSPEQARGEQVDARSDVYAAGCVLYELITGEPPFTGDSPVAVAYQHVREDPHPPSTVNPAVSPELDAVVLKALAKGPANRYQSSAEMRSDLVRTLSGQRPSAPMVMSEDERTQVMDSDRRQPQRYDEYADDDPEAEAAAKRKRRTVIAVISAVLVAVIVLLILLLNGTFKNSGTKVAVPDVTGQLLAQARDTLQTSGFTNIVPKNVTCGGTPVAGQPTCSLDQVNHVISMDPPGKTPTLTTTAITLSVGTAPNQVPVPDLTGLSQVDAGTKLTQASLQLNPNIQQVDVTDQTQDGKVQTQTPAAGTSVAPNASVQITVGKFQTQANVPDVTNESYNDANTQLTGLGFKVKKTSTAGSQPKDTVIDQSIKGLPAPKGTTITLTVSDGSQGQITMPDLTGKTYDQAVAALQAKGWNGQPTQRSDKSSDPTATNTVTRTDPAAGSQIAKDQAVSIYVAEPNGGSTTPTTSGLFPPSH